LVVGKDESDAKALLAAQKPTIVKQWKMADFKNLDKATFIL